MVRKTRKQAKNGKAMTIIQLRKAFDHIEHYVKAKKPDVESFCKEWKKTFGKEVSHEAAEDYLKFVSTKGQGGGGSVAITPAPLGYDLRAGAETPHGSFPEYVSGGFGFANKPSFVGTNEIVNFPNPPAGLGSNKVGGGKAKKGKKTRKTKKHRGGGLWDTSKTLTAELFNRPFLANPTAGAQSRMYDTQMLAKGLPGLPSPRPEIHNFVFKSNPANYAAYVSPSSAKF
jgi:hypothetical protein